MKPRQVCELTPGGRGAVCVLQLRADEVAAVVQEFFCAAGKKPLSNCSLQVPVYGYWLSYSSDSGKGNKSAEPNTREDVVVCRRSESELEVHCHGGDFAKRRILDSLESLGFGVVTWRDWSEATQLSHIAMAASRLLPQAQTIKAASVLNWQVSGALDRVIVDVLALLRLNQQKVALKAIGEMASWKNVAEHLVQPWKVAIVGPPNVGKSSLMNRLVGFERALVYDQPGTTRDLVSVLTAINGWPVELTDTAGLRDTEHEIESQGIGLARKALQSADLILCVRDATRPGDSLLAIDDAAIGSRPVINVLNKSDLLTDGAAKVRANSLFVSAMTGVGMNKLIEAIALKLVPVEPEFNQAIPFQSQQLAALQQAGEAVETGDVALAIILLEGLSVGGKPNA